MRKAVIILLWIVVGGGLFLIVGAVCVVVLTSINIEPGLDDHPEFEFTMDPTPRWSPDGSSIVFGHGDGRIYVVAADGSRLYSISETFGKYDVDISPAVSPDGSRIAYATLRHETGFLWDRTRNFEILTSALDGSEKRRLTRNQMKDGSPVWSPTDNLIAFTSSPSISSPSPPSQTIATMFSDGSGVRQVVSSGNIAPGAILSPLAWSPNGELIAFTAIHHRESSSNYAVYVAVVDGSGLTLVRESNRKPYKPSWSPDGARIAFAEFDEERNQTRVYTVDHDGSNLRELPNAPASYLDSLSWSPDGSKILIGSSIVSSDASSLLILPGPGSVASWSPNGSRIAVNVQPATRGILPAPVFDSGIESTPPSSRGVVLYTMRNDGTDRRILVEQNFNGSLSAANGRPLDDGQPVTTIYFDESGRPLPEPFDIEQCSNGVVVPNPDDNRGLVRDCKTLLQIRDSLGANPSLNWSTDIPVSEWERIHQPYAHGIGGVHLTGRNLTGIISAEFGKLRALNDLKLNDNLLHGEIPVELGNLSRLRYLYLGNNELEGEIPAELGNLTSLQELYLSNNELVGEIPPELGNLSSLRELHLGYNELEGEIPAELGNLTELQRLSFDHDQLTGMLEVISMLSLGWLRLDGGRCIPEKIFEMVGMVFYDDHLEICED